MFKVGDRVRATKDDQNGVKKGYTGTVKGVDQHGVYEVEYDAQCPINGHTGYGNCANNQGKFHRAGDLELLPAAPPMINTTARDSVAEALRECKETYAKRFDAAIEAIAKAEKPEEVMVAKRDLLKGLVFNLPLGADTCYFCVVNSVKCAACEYGRLNGICVNPDSTFHKISDAQDRLKHELCSYYSGETYTDPEREKRFVEYKRLKAEFEPA